MNDLKFFSLQKDRPELAFDPDSECYNVTQYEKWFVRINSKKPIIPHIKVKEQFLPLAWDARLQGFFIPQEDRQNYNAVTETINKALVGISGKLIIFDQSGVTLSPFLYIANDSIENEDFAAILDRLGQLAIANESGVVAPVSILQDNGPNSVGKTPLNEDSFAHLAQVIHDNWEIIKKNPAKEIKLDTKIIDLTDAQSSQSVRSIYHAVQKPHQRRQQILERKETFDSAENRFLVHILRDILLPKAGPLAKYFRERAFWIKHMQQSKPMFWHGQNYRDLWQDRRTKIEAEANRLEMIAHAIEKNVVRVQEYLREPFLKEAGSNTSVFLRPSSKIAYSKEYGAVYKAYQAYINNKKTTRSRSLAWALEEKTIRRTSNLFEIWVFLEVYAMLVYDFGFQPDGNSPLDLVEVADGEVSLKAGSIYHLSFTPKNSASEKPLCSMILSYTPTLQASPCKVGKKCFSATICPSLPCYTAIRKKDWVNLTPDMTMIIQTGSITKKFVLDIKYRNYIKQRTSEGDKQRKYNVHSLFELDLLGTAKMKYLNGLEYDAAFCVHSDPNKIYTTFGAEPFFAAPLRERELQETYYPAHQVGAIYITPHHQENLDKLLRCFLMYHIGLEAICWSCHLQLTEENNGMKKQSKLKGDYYQCPECGQFWIGQNCGHPQHHRLIKMGRNSFHKISAENEWNCSCPACGEASNENTITPTELG